MKKDNIFNLIKIDDDKTVPKYKQLQFEIERLIMENLLAVNTMLPGENAFFKWLGLSRTTIRKALQELEEAHLIYRLPGQGTFIGRKPHIPTSNGEKLKSSQMKQVIGVVVPHITNEIYPFIIESIEQTVHNRKICVFSANSGGRRGKELQIVNEMINNSIDGLIIEPLYSKMEGDNSPLVSLLKSLTIPVVLLNNDIQSFECSKIIQNDEDGARLLTNHLLEHGHKRIAYIYNDCVNVAFERRNGYRAALAAAGIQHDPELEVAYNDEEGLVYPGYLLTKGLLERTDLGITAIFYFNDDLALQGMAAAQNMNLEIPGDLSVVGYDDIPRSCLNGIRLTTVSHPKKLLGIWAASLLLEQFDQIETPVHRKITVQSSMVFRDSVSRPRQ
jgi:GntR family transcriptional regulator of arabinose operon